MKPNAKRLDITITQEDIDKGKTLNADSCPAARAIKRHSGDDNAKNFCVFSYIFDERWESSKALIDWICDFDTRVPMKPATFRLTKVGGKSTSTVKTT